MTIEQGFTRKQTMELVGCTSSQLQHLERTNLVVSMKITEGRIQPQVYFLWNQILEIKVIRDLRENTSLLTIRKVLDFFDKCIEQEHLYNKRIVAVDNDVFCVEQDLSNLHQKIATLEVANRKNKGIGKYSLIVLPTIQETIEEILDTARTCTSISLESVMAKRDSQRQAIAA